MRQTRLIHRLHVKLSPLEPTSYHGVAVPGLGLAPIVQLFAQNTLEEPHGRMAHAKYGKTVLCTQLTRLSEQETRAHRRHVQLYAAHRGHEARSPH